MVDIVQANGAMVDIVKKQTMQWLILLKQTTQS